MRKRILSTLLALCMVLTLLPGVAKAAELPETSGTCGDNATWNFDVSAETLTISGTGAMYDYDCEFHSNPPPYLVWNGYAEDIWNTDYEDRTFIRSVVVSEGITHIGSDAFGSFTMLGVLSKLQDVRLPSTLRTIGNSAFTNAESLTSIDLPSGLRSIDAYAFSGTRLESIHIPASTTEIGHDALPSSLNVIAVDSNNPKFLTIDDVLYQRNSGSSLGLLIYPHGKTDKSYIMPDQVDTIPDQAFAYNQYLESIAVSSNLKTVPAMTFLRCSNLTSITLPEGISTVNSNAFMGCSKLRRVDIPATVTSFVSELMYDMWEPSDSSVTEIYFHSLTAPEFDAEGAIDKTDGGKIIIYYPQNATGWDAVQQQENLKVFLTEGTLEFRTWNPEPAGLAQWTKLYPANGATDVGYEANAPAHYQITFDREIANDGVHAEVDLTSNGAFAIYRATDDALVYKPSQYASSDFKIVYQSENVLSITPVNNHTLLEPGTEYYITMGEGFVRFKDGTTNQAINKGDWVFATELASFATEASITIGTGDKKVKEHEVEISWNDRWFSNSISTYNHELALTSMGLSGAAYIGEENIQISLEKLGFERSNMRSVNYDYHFSKADNDVVAYTFATKKIFDYNYGQTHDLILVIIRGTPTNEEWFSNFNIGLGNTHEGFDLAASKLLKSLTTYMRDHNLSKDKTKFLITGHSRGGGVANLVAAQLNEQGYYNYCYTFAAPTVSVYGRSRGYLNIFNIVNAEDFVPQVPLSKWDFARYGIDLVLPSKTFMASNSYKDAYDDMNSVFEEMLKRNFEHYPDGTQNVGKLTETVYKLAPSQGLYYTRPHTSGFLTTNTVSDYFDNFALYLSKEGLITEGFGNFMYAFTGEFVSISTFFLWESGVAGRVNDAHCMATYFSWLKGCSAEELFGTTNKASSFWFKRLRIACPVDVYVYDESGSLAVSVVNEQIENNILAVSVEAGIKTIDLPNDQEYSIKIVATDEGSVSYTVEELSAEGVGNSTLRTVGFNDINISEGDELTGTVNNVIYTDNVNYALTKNDTDKIYADYDSYTTLDPAPSYPSGGNTGNDSRPTTYSITLPTIIGGTVTTNPSVAAKGATVTLTATPDEGYELASLTVADSKGNDLELTDKGNGKFTFTMPGSEVTVNAIFQLIPLQKEPQTPETPWVNTFNDVAGDIWYYGAIKFVSGNGLMNGISSNLFAPDANLSRAQLAQILYNKEGKPAVNSGSTFTDVATTGIWYSDAVTWAATNGVVGGYGNGLFGPDDNITREQLAVMLWRYAGSPAATDKELHFTDADKASGYALEALRWAVGSGIINGKGGGVLDPQGFATRAQVAQMLKNYLER